jgi:hypothetical protein
MLDETSLQILPELINAYYKEFKTAFILSSHQSFNLFSLRVSKIQITDRSLQLIT